MSATPVILNARLRKNNEPYQIRHLQENDILAITTLHKIILDNLKPGQECFIHKKSSDDFRKMIQNPQHLFIGAFCGENLIAYASANFVNQRTIDNVLPNFALDYEADKIAVLEQASVNPAYRGNNLASIMNALRQKIAYQEHGRRYAVTMVDIKNFYSYRNGFRNGMCITQAAIDPDDGGHIIYMSKEIGKETRFNISHIPQELSYEEMDIDNVSALIEQGYVARGYDDSRRKVIFNKTNDFKYKGREAKVTRLSASAIIFSSVAARGIR